MALLHLAQRAFPGRVCAVTVDHGLRPESAAEAAGVAAHCAAAGIFHATLRWSGPDPTGNLMDQARQARARLMAEWAVGRGISHILLGHTADDQAESFVMNLARAAGLEGLSGMRPVWQDHGITWHRPLLAVSRAALRQYLTDVGQGWADDPSNDNPRFTRARVRKTMALLDGLGITVQTLGQTARHLQAARAALWSTLAAFVATHVTETAGAVQVPQAAFRALPADLRRTFLLAVLRWMAGQGHAPAAPALARFQAAAEGGRPATLAGVMLRPRAPDLLFVREPRAVQGAVPYGDTWDHRWQVTGPALPGLTIGALGVAGLQHCPDWPRFGRRAALVVMPALWQDGRLIAAPLAGLPGEWQAETVPCLHSFILSH